MWLSLTRARPKWQAAVKPGHAAECAEKRKRQAYPGGRLVPAAVEAYGRCGESPLTLQRGLCRTLNPTERVRCLTRWRQRIAVGLQRHNTAMLTTALGPWVGTT